MDVSKIKIGHRVRIKNNGLTALVVGRPEYYRSSSKLIRIKYERSTKYEYMIDNQINLLPQENQYPALGGNYTAKAGEI